MMTRVLKTEELSNLDLDDDFDTNFEILQLEENQATCGW